MFSLKHGSDDQTTLFNSKCQIVVLLSHIKRTLNLRNVAIDVIPVATDYKSVLPLGLLEKGEFVYANTILQPRGTYALLQVNEDEDGVREYVSLWKAKGEESEKLHAALEARAAEERKKATGKSKGAKK